jgi:hypothetical protein
MPDTRYLRRRVGKRRSGDRWYVRVPVPKNLRGRFGELEAVERGLGTGDLREAQRRRHAIVAEILELFDRTRDSRPEDAVAEELAQAYATWRETYLALGRAGAQALLSDVLEAGYMQVSDREYIPTPGEQWHERACKALQRCGVEPALNLPGCGGLVHKQVAHTLHLQKRHVPRLLDDRMDYEAPHSRPPVQEVGQCALKAMSRARRPAGGNRTAPRLRPLSRQLEVP